ncbi:MAG: hypothetical protein GY847_09985 [Proteobacteria bacterium]|nr:hypothetical protein [Pseudomonadota bacterium]
MTDLRVQGVRFEAGAMIPATLETVAAELSLSFCDVTGFGELKWVELAGALEGETRRLRGPLQLLDLKGRLRLTREVVLHDFVCTVSRHTDNGIQLLGGTLKRAEITFAELTFTPLAAPLDSIVAVATKEQKSSAVPRLVSNSSLPRSPTPIMDLAGSSRRITTPGLEARWTKAIAESNRVQRLAEDQDDGMDAADVRLKIGDIIHHRQFGKCTIMRVGDEHITLRKPDKRIVQLGLSILKFIPDGEEDGHAVYCVEVKPKR